MIFVIASKLKKITTLHWFLFCLVTLFVISQFISVGSSYDLVFQITRGNIYYFNRYIYILIFILFIKTIKIDGFIFKKIYNYLEIILFINCFLILIGLIFEINTLKSYENTVRFGYAGLFSKPEEAGFIYCIAIIFNYHNWVLNKKKIHFLKTIIFIITILLLGQKKMILFAVILVSFHLMYQIKYYKYFRILIPSTLFIVVVFSNFFFKFLINHSSFWTRVYNQRGLLSAVTSLRSDLLKEAVVYIKNNWNILNFMFGGINFNKYKVEFELFDLFMFFGLFGLLLYLYMLYFYFYKNLDSLMKKLVLILFITSFFGGGLLLNVTPILLLYLSIKKVIVNKQTQVI